MNGILFDTDVLIEILRGNARIIEYINSEITDKTLACSCITVGEIFAGMLTKEEIPTRKLLDTLIKIPVTEDIAQEAGKLKAKTKSHMLALDDCIIAASAMRYEFTLFTKNIKHYPFKKLNLKRVL